MVYILTYMHCLITPFTSLSFRQCLAFSFAKVLQQELDEFVSEWNSHRIRYNRRADCPAGIPDDLFDMPECVGTSSWLALCMWYPFKNTDHCLQLLIIQVLGTIWNLSSQVSGFKLWSTSPRSLPNSVHHNLLIELEVSSKMTSTCVRKTLMPLIVEIFICILYSHCKNLPWDMLW